MNFLLRKLSLSVLFIVVIGTNLQAQLQVTTAGNTATALAQYLVGDGVTISNATITGSTQSIGFFKNISGNQLNIDSGVVLSTGRVATTGTQFGVNGIPSNFASSSMSTPGDPQLQALINNLNTNDAIILEFDFIPLGDSISFRYVFSSEEYPQFNCSSFNDVFAFFISGPGITGVKNIALVPGTNIPVAINSVNSGFGGTPSLCANMGPGSPFTQYYVTNTGNSLTHNGHTVVFYAKAAVQPCQTYHLKIAIADAGDSSYDSGVFLEARSLTSPPVTINSLNNPTFNGLPYLVEGCNAGSIAISRAKKLPESQLVHLFYAGTATNGVDVNLLPPSVVIPANDSVVVIPIQAIQDNITEGTEYLKIYVGSSCGGTGINLVYTDSITLMIREYDFLTLVPDDTVFVCRTIPTQLSVQGTYQTYNWFPALGLNDSTISNPVASPQTNTTYTLVASVGTCHSTDSVTLIVKGMEYISQQNVNCFNGTTGQIKVGSGPEWSPPVQFNLNNGPWMNDSTFNNLPVGLHIVKVTDPSGCVDSMEVDIIQAFPTLQLADSTCSASCDGINGKIFLSASGGAPSYSFSIDGINYSSVGAFTVNSGTHNVYVKDSNNCVTSHAVNILTDPPIDFTIAANPDACNGGPSPQITVTATGGSGAYSYSVDGVNFQSSNVLDVTTSTVTVTVMDNKACSHTKTYSIPVNKPVTVDAGGNQTLCEGTSLTIPATSTAANFSWSPTTNLSNPSVLNPVANPTTTTTYYLTATKGICVIYDTMTVVVLPAPVADAGADFTICYGRTVPMNGSGGIVYDWKPASMVSNSTIANPTTRPTTTTTYTLQVIDANGCRSLNTDDIKITVTPPIQTFAGNDTSVAIGQPLQLTGIDLGNSGATIFQWTPSTGLNNPNIFNPIATLTNDMTYILTISTPDGCEGTDTINIKAYKGPEFYVPSAFTPNGDGRNDVLRPIIIGFKTLTYFRVFNRWGQQVFATSRFNHGWDGTINGQPQPTGTFIWVAEGIDYMGNKIQQKGTATLIR